MSNDKVCGNCRHRDVLSDDPMCINCILPGNFPPRPNWEPAFVEPDALVRERLSSMAQEAGLDPAEVLRPAESGPPSIRPAQQLVLLRGIPGAGKTTLAGTIRALSEAAGEVWVTFEKDAWRGYGEERQYQHKYNENAEHWCIGMTADALAKGKSVIVANTFSKLSYMFPYFQLASELRTRGHKITTTVCHVQGPVGRSVHSGDIDYNHYISEWQEYNGEFQDV